MTFISDPASVAGPEALKTLIDSYNGVAVYDGDDRDCRLIGHVKNARWENGQLIGDVAMIEEQIK